MPLCSLTSCYDQKYLVVPDLSSVVHFNRSNSEIVVPLLDKKNDPLGVLDVDSQSLNSFSEIDKEWLEKIVLLI